MKKLLAIAAAFAFSAVSAFASVEFDLHFVGTFFDVGKADIDDSSIGGYSIPLSGADMSIESRPEFSAGVESSTTFFFGKAPSKIEGGINFMLGFQGAKKDEIKFKAFGYTTTETFDVNEFDLWFGLGPALRFSPTKRFSLFLKPDFVVMLRKLEYTGSTSIENKDISLGLDLDVGGRVWLLSGNAMSMGLDIGMKFNYMKCIGQLDSMFPVTVDYDGTRMRLGFYAGICLNLGKRGIDQ